MKARLWAILFLFPVLGMIGCSSSGTSSDESVSVSSLTSIPSMDDILDSESTSSLNSALIKAAVSGTPPAMGDITDESAKTLFWEAGLIDTLAAGGGSTEE